MLSGGYRIEHYRDVSARRVLHSAGNVKTARAEAVLLILYRPRTDGNVRKHVGQVAVVFRIKHLVGAGKSCFGKCPHVKRTDGDKPLQHIRALTRVGLMEHSLVAVAGRSGLVRVYARHDNDPVADPVLPLL